MPVVGKVEGAYDPHAVEEWVKRFWERERIYSLVREWRRGRRRFYFLDGPPYPSSDVPHAGTAWNKVLKDSILRYKRMRGFDVVDTPGYDCHGLPIEVAVEKRLGIRVKREIETRIGVDRFIEECKRLVRTNIEGLTRWFRELGVFMDWENPYITMDDRYIEAAWWLVKKAHEKGLLRREHRVVYWCPRCGTTLAEYEIEYRELTDPSIYVKFPVKGRSNEYLLIWTTTPWTLPANAFVMAHPDAVYVRVRIGDEVYIVARSRLDHVVGLKGGEYEVLEEFPGKRLEGLEYTHPLEDVVPLQKRLAKYHRVVMAPEYVALHEGTGLVHAAPGHGFEDFEVARRIGVDDIVAPIDDEGRFTSDAGPYAGIPVREANARIIEDLRKLNALYYAGSVTHRYPVCWRCKTPVVLRATPQWVIKVTRLKEKLGHEVKRASWIPGWALDRIMSMIEGLQDWVLSRQRYWGTPLPIWVCEKCGHIVVVGSASELEKYGGARPRELHKPWIDSVVLKCPKCSGAMRRVPDVMDVWFDSGVAFYASRGHPEKDKDLEHIVDFITEGHDQTRGWFFSLLRAGVIGFDTVPYRVVLVHGFMLDEKGREMHKSLGNYVGTDEILAKAGRDVFRFWILQNRVWEDARFSWRALEQARSDLSIAWNVFVFASTYMSLDGFDPAKHRLDEYIGHLRAEDRWLLSRAERLVEKVTELLDSYTVHEAVRALRDFIVEDVSHWYIRLVRRRVWIEEDDPSKYAVYVTLYHVLKTWLALVAPFIPFIAERLYQAFVRPAEPNAPPSVHMLDWPKPDKRFIDRELEEYMDIVREIAEAAAAARMEARIKLRQPVRKVIVFTGSEKVYRAVERLRDIVLQATNAKDVELRRPELVEELVTYSVEPVYEVIGPRYKKLTSRIVEYLEREGDRVARDILSTGTHKTVIDGVEVVLDKNSVRIIPVYRRGFAVKETSWGSVAIDTTLTEEEIADGIARDVVRRIQYMRKLLNLDVEEDIDVTMYVPREHVDYVRRRLGFISAETRARRIEIVESRSDVRGKLVKEWVIEGEDYVIGISPSGG